MVPGKLQFTTRNLAVAVLWLSVCLALWTAPNPVSDSYRILFGWVALCLACAALFGVATRFALAMLVASVLTLVSLAVLAALTPFVPARAATIVVVMALFAGSVIVRTYGRSRRRWLVSREQPLNTPDDPC
jgi:hypothetical protein